MTTLFVAVPVAKESNGNKKYPLEVSFLTHFVINGKFIYHRLLLLLLYHCPFQALTVFTMTRHMAGIASGFLTFSFFPG
jgi:hypothetical protein